MDIAVLGRVKPLAEAELRAVSSSVQRVSGDFCLFKPNSSTQLWRLGGTVKQAKVVYHDKKLTKEDIASLIVESLSQQNGKLQFGISIYPDQKRNHHDAYSIGQLVKEALRAENRNSRFVPPKPPFSALNAAQIRHNKLLDGGEFLIYTSAETTMIGRSYDVQDVDWYANRDYNRPFRDSKVGMVPPKLAQMMINLAQSSPDTTIYDPFCGGGTILAESMLIGYSAAGSDIDKRLVDGAKQNLDWLKNKQSITTTYTVFVADAASVILKDHHLAGQLAIITEGYLGNVERVPNSQEQDALNQLYKRFLINLAGQIAPATQLVVASPFWPKGSVARYLPFLDQINDLGYNSKAFEGVDNDSLIYIRSGQRVGRKISLLIRK